MSLSELLKQKEQNKETQHQIKNGSVRSDSSFGLMLAHACGDACYADSPHCRVVSSYQPGLRLIARDTHARWETPRGRYDEYSSKFSPSSETKVIEPVGVESVLEGVNCA